MANQTLRRARGAFSTVDGFSVISRADGSLTVRPKWQERPSAISRLLLAQQVQELLNSRCQREAGQ